MKFDIIESILFAHASLMHWQNTWGDEEFLKRVVSIRKRWLREDWERLNRLSPKTASLYRDLLS